MKRCTCGGEIRLVGHTSSWGPSDADAIEFHAAEQRGEDPEWPPMTEQRTPVHQCRDCGKTTQ